MSNRESDRRAAVVIAREKETRCKNIVGFRRECIVELVENINAPDARGSNDALVRSR